MHEVASVNFALVVMAASTSILEQVYGEEEEDD